MTFYKWYGYSNCLRKIRHTVIYDTCSCARRILHASQYALFPTNCSCSPSSAVRRRRANNIGLPAEAIDGEKRVRSWGSRWEPAQPYSYCTINKSFTQNQMHICILSECAAVHFKNRLTKQLGQWKYSTWVCVQYTWNGRLGVSECMAISL
jgi:hypothetical protein